jgi:hypothetical protein
MWIHHLQSPHRRGPGGFRRTQRRNRIRVSLIGCGREIRPGHRETKRRPMVQTGIERDRILHAPLVPPNI